MYYIIVKNSGTTQYVIAENQIVTRKQYVKGFRSYDIARQYRATLQSRMRIPLGIVQR